jgi:HSP20 family protein
MQEEVNRVFGDLWADTDESRAVAGHWVPAVDIREEGDRFVLSADLPGVAAKDLEVTMEAGHLTIKGARKREDEANGEGYRRTERANGSFYRRFLLPDTADGANISAKSKDGVLEVVIPKKAQTQPRKIEILH